MGGAQLGDGMGLKKVELEKESGDVGQGGGERLGKEQVGVIREMEIGETTRKNETNFGERQSRRVDSQAMKRQGRRSGCGWDGRVRGGGEGGGAEGCESGAEAGRERGTRGTRGTRGWERGRGCSGGNDVHVGAGRGEDGKRAG